MRYNYISRNMTFHKVFVSSLLYCKIYIMDVHYTYRMHAIITRGLYISYSIFHCGLYCRAVSVIDNLCTKQGNSSIFWSKIRGL